MRSKLSFRPVILIAALAMAALSSAQVPSADKANWKLADRYSSDALRPFSYSTNLTPGWINKTGAFWYLWRGQDGVKFWRVDCKGKAKEPLFDTPHMAALLSTAVKKPFDTANFPITTVTFDEKNENLMRFT